MTRHTPTAVHSHRRAPRVRVLPLITALALVASAGVCPAAAQSILERAKQRAQDKIKEHIDQKVDSTVDKTPDRGEAPAHRGSSGSGAASVGPTSGGAADLRADAMRPGEGAWANYDFVPGARVLFADDFTRDNVGDFPRRLELKDGSTEIVDWKGRRLLRVRTETKFYIPLPETLPAQYTIEFDFSTAPSDMLRQVPLGSVWLFPAGDDSLASNSYDAETPGAWFVGFRRTENGVTAVVDRDGKSSESQEVPVPAGQLVHARILADGRYVKLYVGNERLLNIPNFTAGRTRKILVWLDPDDNQHETDYIGDIRVAAGGRKLYEALAASGRVATQGIYFDPGSDRIRPESTPTLKEIAAMLRDHPDLKLAIEGHTDNTGQAASNLALSEKRAAAVKAALVSQFGAPADRLTTKGLGQTKPVASNDTPEGRQQNRRVELVRM